MQLHNEFENSGIVCARDRSKRSVAKARIGSHQRWRVGHVKRFGAKLRTELFLDWKGFAYHRIEGAVGGTNDRISRRIADRELSRLRKGGRVEPSRRAVLI